MTYVTSGQTSSLCQTWETSQAFFDQLNERFHFTLDVAADEHNAKCGAYIDEQNDALKVDWQNEICFCNPPYNRLAQFVHKARVSAQNGATVVMLIPAQTDTRYWHNDIFPFASEILFVKGRLKFGHLNQSAPFPSAVIVFTPTHQPQIVTTITPHKESHHE